MVRSTNGTIITTCPAISTGVDGRSPISVKYISSARPIASDGSTTGDMNRRSRRPAHRQDRFAIANAASVPSVVAIAVEQVATIRLFSAARWISADFSWSNSARYQRVE